MSKSQLSSQDKREMFLAEQCMQNAPKLWAPKPLRPPVGGTVSFK